MRKEDLLTVSNYRIMYNEAWESDVGFIERGEEFFPLQLGDDSLDVLSFVGEPFVSRLCVLCTSKRNEWLCHEAYRFGLELALNDVACTCPSSKSPVAQAFRDGFLSGGGRLELFLGIGMLNALSKEGFRRFISVVLVRSGVVYSPFDPAFSAKGVLKESALLRDHLSSRKEEIVLLGLDADDKPLVEDALMAGCDVAVHTSFLSSPCARMLANEGACLIGSAADYLLMKGGEIKCLVHPDERGLFSHRGMRYGCFFL